jgi:aspartyl-tRNA(Asn)/glutamyl-tRNA(Gln) amidotransferase subunit A
MEQAIGELRTLGAEVRDIEIPDVGAGVAALFGIVLAEAQEIHAKNMQSHPLDFGTDVHAILASEPPDTMTLMRALRHRDTLSVAVRNALESVDLLVTPSTPIVAARIGQETVAYGELEEPILMAMIRCTAPFNATGHPALSLPCGFTSAGLPVGLQIVGRTFDEATVLRAGHAYEQATGWHKQLPQL